MTQAIVFTVIIAFTAWLFGRKRFPAMNKPAGTIIALGLVSLFFVNHLDRDIRPLEVALTKAYGAGKHPLTTCNKGEVQGQLFARCYSSQLWKVTENETGYTYTPYNGKALSGLEKMNGLLPDGNRFGVAEIMTSNPTANEVLGTIPWDK